MKMRGNYNKDILFIWNAFKMNYLISPLFPLTKTIINSLSFINVR